jgi:hypothetical protein
MRIFYAFELLHFSSFPVWLYKEKEKQKRKKQKSNDGGGNNDNNLAH